MKASVDVPESYRRSLAGIDYTSPVCKINVALNKLPNFLANPNTGDNTVMPHHKCTIHINCEKTEMIEEAYQDAKLGQYSRLKINQFYLPSSDSILKKAIFIVKLLI